LALPSCSIGSETEAKGRAMGEVWGGCRNNAGT